MINCWKKIILLIIISVTSISLTAQKTKQNLTVVLMHLTEHYKTVISFSPTLTNSAYPVNKPSGSSFEKDLKLVLLGTDFDYRVIGGKYYQIIKKKKNVSIKPKPTPKEPEVIQQDTAKHIAQEISVPERKIIRGHYIHNKNSNTNIEFNNTAQAVQNSDYKKLSSIAFKTNIVSDISANLNLGFEFAVAPNVTMTLSGTFNEWSKSQEKKFNSYYVTTGARLWNVERYYGSFWSAEAQYANFDWGWKSMFPYNSTDKYYSGSFIGFGIGYGYHFVLGGRWGLETEIGLGYRYIDYSKHDIFNDTQYINKHKHYFGPTKVAINLIYLIK